MALDKHTILCSVLVLCSLSCTCAAAPSSSGDCKFPGPGRQKVEEFLEGAVCSQAGPQWALALQERLRPELAKWEPNVFYMNWKECGLLSVALRTALHISEFPQASHPALHIFAWADNERWRDLLFATQRPMPQHGRLLHGLYAGLSDLWALHRPSAPHSAALVATLQSHHEATSPSITQCRLPITQQVMGPQRLGAHESLRHLLTLNILSPTASVEDSLLSACLAEQLAVEAAGGNRAQAEAFLTEALYARHSGINKLPLQDLVFMAPAALGLLHRQMLLSEAQLPSSVTARPNLSEAPLETRRLHALAAYQALYALAVLLDHFKVDWWMTYSSLLGAMRNGGIIPHDTTVDVAIGYHDLAAILTTDFKQTLLLNGLSLTFDVVRGFQVQSHPTLPGETTPGSGGVSINLWLFTSITGDRVAVLDRPNYPPHKGLSMTWEQLHPHSKEGQQRRVLFGEVEVRVPWGAETFLDQLYGEDWRTHVRDRSGELLVPPRTEEAARGDPAAAGPMLGPTGPLNRVVKLSADRWLSGTPPEALLHRVLMTVPAPAKG